MSFGLFFVGRLRGGVDEPSIVERRRGTLP